MSALPLTPQNDNPRTRSLKAPADPVRVVLIGLGKLGQSVANGVLEDPGMNIAAVTDLAPDRVGRDLGAVLGRPATGLVVESELPRHASGADIAVLMTSSRMSSVVEPIESLLAMGLDVVTSAEELAFPWQEFPNESARLDHVAREHGRSVLGAGANPGFLMDTLPAVMSVCSKRVNAVWVTRTMDLRPHRAERLARFGLGVTADIFGCLPSHVLHGHIGFRQSLDALASCLQLPIDRVEHHNPAPVVVTSHPRDGQYETLPSGTVAVVRQGATAYAGSDPVATLTEYFGFIDEDDDIPGGDSYRFEGVDQSFNVSITPGVESFATTPAVLLNMIRPVLTSPPGLRTMHDFTVAELASKGHWAA